MRKSTICFLQTAIVFIGITALAFLLWEPHVEGRNVNATFFEIYFNDPFLAYAYVASISFFMALYRAYRVLGDVRKQGSFSQTAITDLRTIRYCAFAMIAFVIGGEVFILSGNTDDRPPALFMGLLVTLAAVAIATTAAKFERMARRGMKM